MHIEKKIDNLVASYKRFRETSVGEDFINTTGHRLRFVACPTNYLEVSQPITADNNEEVDEIIKEFVSKTGILHNEYIVEKWGQEAQKKYLFLEALKIDIHNII